MDVPAVSVVMATYNRPRALAHAMRSALAQTVSDLELLVIGDACGPETGEVVASFGDPRVRYENLERNFGEQSGPNNLGVSLARGRAIAFLNHDDLWFPDHLALRLGDLAATGADLVYAAYAEVSPGAGMVQDDAWTAFLISRPRGTPFAAARMTAPASTWLMRREVAATVGPWRPGKELYAASSQDFLFRAQHQGLRLLAGSPDVTLLAFPSGRRPGSYVTDAADEQAYFLREILADPAGLRARLAAHRAPRKPRGLRRRTVDALFGRAFALAGHFGLSPRELDHRFRRGLARGAFLRELRRVRGLDPDGPPNR